MVASYLPLDRLSSFLLGRARKALEIALAVVAPTLRVHAFVTASAADEQPRAKEQP